MTYANPTSESQASVDYKNSVRATAQGPLVATRVGNVLTANVFGALVKTDIDPLWTTGAALAADPTCRILLPYQVAGEDNGIWYPIDLGSAGTPWVMIRAADADTSAEVTSGMLVPVTEGTDATRVYFLATAGVIALNTTPLSFSVISGVKPILWSVTADPAPGNYPNGTSAVMVMNPGAPRSQYLPDSWTFPPIDGAHPLAVPGVRLTFSDGSQLIRFTPFQVPYTEYAKDIDYGKDGLWITGFDFIVVNSGLLANINFDAFHVQGQVL